MTGVGAFLGITFMAGLVEFLAEQIFGQFLKGRWMQLAAVGLGIALALVFRVGLFAGLNLAGVDMTTTVARWADFVVTGALVGGGSTKLHEFFKKYIAE